MVSYAGLLSLTVKTTIITSELQNYRHTFNGTFSIVTLTNVDRVKDPPQCR